jgi:hypothetical protein
VPEMMNLGNGKSFYQYLRWAAFDGGFKPHSKKLRLGMGRLFLAAKFPPLFGFIVGSFSYF